MTLTRIHPGIATRGGYAPATIAHSAAESARPDLWRNCTFASLCNGVYARDLITGRYASPKTNAGGLAPVARLGTPGRGVYCDSGNSTTAGNLSALSYGSNDVFDVGAADFTYVFYGRYQYRPTIAGCIGSLAGGSSGNPGAILHLNSYNSGNGQLSFRAGNGSTGYVAYSGTGFIADGDLFIAVGVRRNNVMELWCQGALIDTTTCTGSFSTLAGFEFWLGSGYQSTSLNYEFGFSGNVFFGAAFARALAPAEIALLHIDPFAMLRRRPLTVPLASTRSVRVALGRGRLSRTGYATYPQAGAAASLAAAGWTQAAYAPVARAGTAAALAAGARALTGRAATVKAGATLQIEPGAITLQSLAAQVAAGQRVTLDATALEWTGYAPDVQAGSNVSITIGTARTTLSGQAPVLTAGQALTIESADSTRTAQQIQARAGASLDIGAGAWVLSGYPITLTLNGIQYLTVDALTITPRLTATIDIAPDLLADKIDIKPH